MNENNKMGIFIVFMFVCLQCYQVQQELSLDSKVREYEAHVKDANMWTILTRGADYSDKHPNEFPIWKLIRREIQMERMLSAKKNNLHEQ